MKSLSVTSMVSLHVIHFCCPYAHFSEVSYKISVAPETPSVVVVHMAMKTIGALKK